MPPDSISSGIYPVIAYEGICHGYNLSLVGRVRYYLLISGHPCIEDNFPQGLARGGEGISTVYTTVLKNQYGRWFLS